MYLKGEALNFKKVVHNKIRKKKKPTTLTL